MSQSVQPAIPGSAGVPAGTNKENAGGDASAPAPTPEWYSRGYLPHRNAKGLIQSITFRLDDSLSREKLLLLEEQLAAIPEKHQNSARRKQIEDWLDAGSGCCALRHPEVARYVQDSLLHFHGERYHLHAWCIMPNHVHLLAEPVTSLASIVQGWKSFTSRWILKQNKRLQLGIPKPKRLWMREYWDRYIRDDDHYRSAVDYIHRNPFKAGLCQQPEDWPWSSAGKAGSAGVPAGTNRENAGGDASAPSDTNTPK